MKKKIISITLCLAMIFTLFAGTAVSTQALTLGDSLGDNVIVTEKNNTPVVLSGSNAKTIGDYNVIWSGKLAGVATQWSNYGQSSTTGRNNISQEGDTADETLANANAYGGTGLSVKSVITAHDFDIATAANLKNGNTSADGHYSQLRINTWKNMNTANLETTAFGVWVKAPVPMNISLEIYTPEGKEMISDVVTVPVGESVVEVPLSNFVLRGGNPIVEGDVAFTVQQVRIYYERQDGKDDETTVYFDNVGYYTKAPVRGLTQRNKAVTVLDYENVTSVPSNYQVLTGAGTGNTSKAITKPEASDAFPEIKTNLWNFDENINNFAVKNWHKGTITRETAAENVYGGTGGSLKFEWLDDGSDYPPVIRRDTEWSSKTGDGLVFWVKAEKAETLEISFHTDWNNNVVKKTVNINAGENIVMVKWSDFEGEYTQTRMIYFAIEAKTNKSNVLYYDNFASYIEPVETDEIANPNAYGGDGQSFHAHFDSCNTGWNFINLNNLVIPLTENGNKWGKDAVISIWVNSSRKTELTFEAWDSDKWYNGDTNKWTTSKKYTINAGENIIRIPVSDFDTAAGEGAKKWEFLDSLRFNFVWMDNKTALDLYIDQIAVEYPIIGDANDDEVVDLRDLIRIKKLLAANEQPTLIKALDVNASGVFGNDDLVTFAKYLIKKGELATSPHVAPAPEDGTVVTTALDWGYDA